MTLMAETVTETAPGFYLMTTDRGFVVHMCACAEHLQRLRDMTGTTLKLAGVGQEAVESAQLVASELVGNAVRACGDLVPLVVEIGAEKTCVSVKVHDPEPNRMPRRRLTALDDEDAETGRGLGLIDLLSPGWQTRITPVGKQIICRVPATDPCTTNATTIKE
ncbi:ATP-binding protein [Streptomyces sp. NPDC001515]